MLFEPDKADLIRFKCKFHCCCFICGQLATIGRTSSGNQGGSDSHKLRQVQARKGTKNEKISLDGDLERVDYKT